MSAFWQQEIQPRFWADIFYTTYTTVRTAVLTPIIMLLVFTVLRLAGQRSLTESTLFNKITLVALGSLVGGTALRPNTPLVSVAIATVIIVGFTVAVNHIYMRGWIPGAALRAHPILLWVNGETAAVIGTPAAARDSCCNCAWQVVHVPTAGWHDHKLIIARHPGICLMYRSHSWHLAPMTC